jgi:hypothetical protein
MARIELFQIHYDERSRASLDPDFRPWDNSVNQRPDWAEYWSFRAVWMQHRAALSSSDYLGIFSPRFKDKTGLTGRQVADTVSSSQSDVISFSPYPTHIAFYINVFEQGERYHPGLQWALSQCMHAVGEPIEWTEVIGTFRNTIFSNYFVAKVSVWEELMDWTERLFGIAEAGTCELAQALNREVSYIRGPTPMKVFIFERLISLLIWRRQWKADLGIAFEAWSSMKRIKPEQCSAFLSLEAMKSRFLETSQAEYLEEFFCLRKELMQQRLNLG